MKQALFVSVDRNKADALPFQIGQTSSLSNSLGFPGEFRPSGASSGVTDEQLRQLLPLIRFEVPSESPAFTWLALQNTTGTSRVLVHGNYTPAKEGTPAQAWVQVLLGLASTYEAHQTIQTWGSDQWFSSPTESQGTLSDAFFLPVSTELDDTVLRAAMAQEPKKELIRFTLNALLSTSENTRIILNASHQQIALCIYAISRVLPASLLENLTFTTYQKNPLESTARIVGTQTELAPDAVTGKAVVFNSSNGNHSALGEESLLATTLVQLLCDGSFVKIDEHRTLWQRLGIKSASHLDSVHRIQSNREITQDEMKQLLVDPNLAIWVGQSNKQLKQLLIWSLQSVDFATDSFPRVLGTLRTKPESLASLGDEIQAAGMSAVNVGDMVTAKSALEVLLPMVAPAKVQPLWQKLYQDNQEPEKLSWEMRSYLLPKLARMRPVTPGTKPDEVVSRWLKVPEDKLAAVLALGLPQGYQVGAVLEAAKNSHAQLSPIAQAISKEPGLVHNSLALLDTESKSDSSDLPRDLFAAVLQENNKHNWSDGLLKQADAISPNLLDACLNEVLEKTPPSITDLVKQHGSTLFNKLSGRKSLETIASRVLGENAGEQLGDSSIRSFVEKLDEVPGLNYELKNRRAAALAVHHFAKEPSLKKESLMEVASALQQVPPLFKPETRTALLQKVIPVFGRGETSFVEELTNFLLCWGPLFGGPSSLCRQTLELMKRDRSFWKQSERIVGFMAIAMDATDSAELNQQTEGLEGDAFMMVQEAHKRNGERTIAQLDQLTTSWPRPAKRQWEFLRKAIVPEKSNRWIRDVLFVVLGVALTSLAFVLLRNGGYL